MAEQTLRMEYPYQWKRATKAGNTDNLSYVDRIETVAKNTYKYRDRYDATVIRFHKTDIITKHSDGRITLNTNGYTTATTKDRINRFANPLRITTDTDQYGERVWMVSDGVRELFYRDGITWSPKDGFRCKQT